MAAALKLKNMSGHTGNPVTRRLVGVTLSGVYATPGQVLDYTALTNPNGIDGGKNFGRIPEGEEVVNQPIGYQCQLVPGATLLTTRLKIWDEAAAAELANGAYPAALTGADAVVIALNHKTGV